MITNFYQNLYSGILNLKNTTVADQKYKWWDQQKI